MGILEIIYEIEYLITDFIDEGFWYIVGFFAISGVIFLSDKIRIEPVDEIEEKKRPLSLESVTNGWEYEEAIAQLITNETREWTGKVTKGSGDQGVDVIALHHSGFKVAIQTKLYSKPVGNKAVQEVVASRIYYKTDEAMVVTNNTFTKSAKELASKTGTQLVNDKDLITLLENYG